MTRTRRRQSNPDTGLGILPLVLAAVPAVASAVPSIVKLFDKNKKPAGPSPAEIQAMIEAERAQILAEQRRNLLMVAGGIAVLGVVGMIVVSRRSSNR